MRLINPFTGKPVEVQEHLVDRLTRAGFKKEEPARPARKPRAKK